MIVLFELYILCLGMYMIVLFVLNILCLNNYVCDCNVCT